MQKIIVTTNKFDKTMSDVISNRAEVAIDGIADPRRNRIWNDDTQEWNYMDFDLVWDDTWQAIGEIHRLISIDLWDRADGR